MKKNYQRPLASVVNMSFTFTLLTGSPASTDSFSISGSGDPINGR
jgi:hypothetical protein